MSEREREMKRTRETREGADTDAGVASSAGRGLHHALGPGIAVDKKMRMRANAHGHAQQGVMVPVHDHLGGFRQRQLHHPSQRGAVDPWSHYSLFSLKGAAAQDALSASPLGLKLKKTPSQVDMLQQELSELSHQTRFSAGGSGGGGSSGGASSGRRHHHGMADPPPHHQRQQHLQGHHQGGGRRARQASSAGQGGQEATRMKASNFPASTLQIGKWKKVAAHEGGLIAKCYYAKKKLVWEVLLEEGRKSKIEISWDDISALSFSAPPQRSAFLEIELSSSPTFKRESDPQPRRHTTWVKRDDFTGGEATACRPHRLFFAPGVLTKHIDRLLLCDERLRKLCKNL